MHASRVTSAGPTWTRRRFLGAAGAGAGSLLLLACGRHAPTARTSADNVVNVTSAAPAGGPVVAAISAQVGGATPTATPIASSGQGLRAFRSRPDLAPPGVTVVTAAHDTAPGLIFVTAGGPMIVDDAGELVWYRQTPQKAATDFRVQTYQGRPVLTWWVGDVPQGHGVGDYVIADTAYREIRRIEASGGPGDLHEFLITPDDTALLTAYRAMPADLSAVGGPAQGALLDSVVQEIDLATGDLRFEWRASEHVAPGASYSAPPQPTDTKSQYDYFHVNSIDVDHDGNLLISSRNTWAVYKVDVATGAVLWTLGGKHSDFAMEPGTTFAWQHDARRQADGTLTLFDDEANPPEAERSRGIVLRLNEETMTATLVRAYTHPGTLLAGSQGNVQVLPNDDVFVGWGDQPWFTEFAQGGDVLFDARFDTANQSYRAFRQPWTGEPADTPAAVAQSDGAGNVAVFVSWNGATQVARWRLFAGPDGDRLAPLAEAVRTGFETEIRIRTTAPVVAVQALDASGALLGATRPVTVT